MDQTYDGRKRVVIENITPCLDGGRFPVKRVVGETVTVQADVFTDGHDMLAVSLLYRPAHAPEWGAAPMQHLGNDRWEAAFTVAEIGSYAYCVQAWVDHFSTWQHDLIKKYDAGNVTSGDIASGAPLLRAAAARADDKSAARLSDIAGLLAAGKDLAKIYPVATGSELTGLVRLFPDKSLATISAPALQVTVDRQRALFSAWYELFPRSCNGKGTHGTFADCERLLPEIARMEFDVLYLPPIHPIGTTARKGKNNTPAAGPADPGSPWAIGSRDGGHTALNPLLGTRDDFRRFVAKAAQLGIEIAIDLAYQCSPDHPHVKTDPDWFKRLPDGAFRCAENPPKKYEDVVPFNFETDDWQALWEELKSIVLHWINCGVRIFRVDNPHTKPFCFWEWLIGEIKSSYPDVIFLAEAFTRPKVMARLAKAGFTQSYTYFTWRNTKQEITSYLTELTQSSLREYFRPNFWPNTPDILPEFLQYGGRPAFMIRLVLAATLSSNYGIYGPAFELCASEALPGREEYYNSEKYEVTAWDRAKPESLRNLIGTINRIRRQNPALQTTWNLRFCAVSNENLLAYGKATDDHTNIILCVVSLDPFHVQEGFVEIPFRQLAADAKQPCLARDLIRNESYIWQGDRAYVKIDPAVMPAHVFQLRMRMRRESDFDYFM